jgi:hypothetical protein
MELSTRQPKWHLTFDGHLLQQLTTYRGLADKSDETIEKRHQDLKLLRDRFRGVPSYELREACIRRELRQSRCLAIQSQIDQYEAMIKQSTGTKRASDTPQRTGKTATRRQRRKRERLLLQVLDGRRRLLSWSVYFHVVSFFLSFAG